MLCTRLAVASSSRVGATLLVRLKQTGACELSETMLGILVEFSQHFRNLFGDKRCYQDFLGTFQGMLEAGH